MWNASLEALHDHLKRLRLPDLTGKSFLDLRAGDGFHCALATAAGASEVVGRDGDPARLAAARRRCPSATLEQAAPGDPIAARFDTILGIDVLDRDTAPAAMIGHFLAGLTPGGQLILEVSVGGLLTIPALRRCVDGLATRFTRVPGVGPSPRWILHAARRRPTVLFLDTAPRSGKSTLAALLAADGPKAVKPVRIDMVFHAIDPIGDTGVADTPLLTAIRGFRQAHPGGNDRVMREIGRAGLIAAFVDHVITTAGGEAAILLWDGFVPEDDRAAYHAAFAARGYAVWIARPALPVEPPAIDIRGSLARLGIVG